MAYGQPAPTNRIDLIKASTSEHAARLRTVGFGVGGAGLVMAVSSCLSWVSDSDESGDYSITGLGSVSMSAKDESFMSNSAMEKFLEAFTSAPGGWTLAFGIVLLLAGACLVLGRFQALAAAVAGVVGLAAFVAAVVFVVDPTSAIVDIPDGEASNDGGSFTRGYGLWLVVVSAVVALGAGGFAAALAVFPERFRNRG